MSKNGATTTVATAPTPATSGTTLTVATGTGTRLFAGMAVLHPSSAVPTAANMEVVTITDVTGDVVTMTRAQESSAARTVVVGDTLTQGLTAAMYDALVASVAAKADAVATTSALAGKANNSHPHSAADVTSGTLPLARGGTGGTDASTARTSLGLGTAAVETPASLAANTAFTATYAPLASPALTGNPTAPTPSPGDNDTSIATTGFVTAAVAAGGGGSSSPASALYLAANFR